MKKLLMILLVVFMLAGCGVNKTKEVPVEYKPETYLELIRNYEIREKGTNETDNEEFNEYMYEKFKESITSDYLYLHFSVRDLNKFDLEKPEVNFGEIEYDNEEAIQLMLEDIEELQSFDYDSLSVKQQYDYDVLEYSFYESMLSTIFSKYNLLFGRATDIISAITTNLNEFEFYTKEDIPDYLTVLEDIDRYIDDCISFTDAQRKDGILHNKGALEFAIDSIDEIISETENNALIASFDYRIDAFEGLSEEEVKEYKEKNRELVINVFVPAFKKLRSYLEDYKKSKTATLEQAKLCSIDKNYAEAKFILKSSTNLSGEELFDLVSDGLDMLIAKYFTALNKPGIIDEYNEFFTREDLPQGEREILEYLRTNMGAFAPVIEVDYDVDVLDEAMATGSFIAYYMSCPLDDLSINKIKVNPNYSDSDYSSMFITLAHEGFPGHLYQNVIGVRQNLSMLRYAQAFTGFTEGYAVYSSRNALNTLGISDELADILFFEAQYYHFLYSVIDLGINFKNWSIDDINEYVRETQVFAGDFSDLYEFLINTPASYIPYASSVILFDMLDQAGKTADFDASDYHKNMTELGNVPYVVLINRMNDYFNQ